MHSPQVAANVENSRPPGLAEVGSALDAAKTLDAKGLQAPPKVVGTAFEMLGMKAPALPMHQSDQGERFMRRRQADPELVGAAGDDAVMSEATGVLGNGDDNPEGTQGPTPISKFS